MTGCGTQCCGSVGVVWSKVGLDDIGGLFQPELFHDSIQIQASSEIQMCAALG